ncbi:non-homologous end-joining DNA ligase [Luteipulveratus flavus]|uniref:Non-homologous end-joining DNA ligase n=1 Tax=Luteipulveratus flavus TaxID=3031728 RepID=A0ABT6C2L6_9MICO|nr:non-homologous end-joining DNA ligase [Luteipulveratus sp. YIM 133296]MDF8262783.1 non-homologous end-joining DNA ligase [Luteipulveratus sp. YIM 133296]
MNASDRLAAYRSMRDFGTTPEPSGDTAAPSTGGLRFVVQRHRATALHYDLRFEMDGVLASWAVPKGPTLDPSVRRMAIHVEDHPIEYVDFEGVIPHGEYGGGDVIVWDRGTWVPHDTDDPVAAVAKGDLHADMYGEKLRGRLVLVRRGPAKEKEQWLLLHKHDDHAVDGWDPEDHPRSVISGRTNEEVKADPAYLWRSDRPAQDAVEVVVGAASGPSDDELAALDRLGDDGTWTVFGRELAVTHLDKELFPGRAGEDPVTKRELLAYTARVAPVVLPYVRDRAMNLHRYPDGATRKGFWQKALPHHAPDWVGRWDNSDADAGETRTYLVVDEPAALVWAANFGALEWHPWTSPTDAPDRPSYALFDIDPGERTTWEETLELARLHRAAFEQLGVRGVPKVTGSRGIQVWVPVRRGPTYDETRAWVERVSRTIGKLAPGQVSWKWRKTERQGRARLDFTQNAVGKTLVAPYSPRPAPGAPVSMPIGWQELDDPTLRPDGWTIRTTAARLDEHGDLFSGALVHDQRLAEFR